MRALGFLHGAWGRVSQSFYVVKLFMVDRMDWFYNARERVKYFTAKRLNKIGDGLRSMWGGFSRRQFDARLASYGFGVELDDYYVNYSDLVYARTDLDYRITLEERGLKSPRVSISPLAVKVETLLSNAYTEEVRGTQELLENIEFYARRVVSAGADLDRTALTLGVYKRAVEYNSTFGYPLFEFEDYARLVRFGHHDKALLSRSLHSGISAAEMREYFEVADAVPLSLFLASFEELPNDMPDQHWTCF